MSQQRLIAFIGVAQEHAEIRQHLVAEHEGNVTGQDRLPERFHDRHFQITPFPAEGIDVDDDRMQSQFQRHIRKRQRIFTALGIADEHRIFPWLAAAQRFDDETAVAADPVQMIHTDLFTHGFTSENMDLQFRISA